jgi:ethanolamine kinase
MLVLKNDVFEQEVNIPKISYSINPTTLLQDSKNLLFKLFPRLEDEQVVFEEETSGLTNKLVKCTSENKTVLIRTFGANSEVLIDRIQESENIKHLSVLGLCPEVYARFDNGMVYGYVEGDVFSLDDMTEKAGLVAKHLAEWHSIKMQHGSKPSLFVTIDAWLEKLPHNSKLSEMTRDHLKMESKLLQTSLEKLQSPVVFCHNDLQVGNVIYNNDRDCVAFIDFEYGAPNFRGFDIGNHFNEFGGIEGNWEKYPDAQIRAKWFNDYLTTILGQTPTDIQVSELEREVLAFSLASHFFWAIWSVVSFIIDIDSSGYQ